MLVKILDSVFFISGLIGVAGFAGAIENGGNVVFPICLIVLAFICYKWARYENGDVRRGRR